MNASDIKQILALANSGMTNEEILEEMSEVHLDGLQASFEDDSDWAYERRCEARGMGQYDFNQYARNDAGEYLNYM
jgi:hypothetical protein